MSGDAPLFRSAVGAVAWAYETCSRVPVKSVSIYSMRGPKHSSRLGLTPDEAHGQAAMILSLVERTLHPRELAYARAKFGRMPEALPVLVTVVLHAQSTGVHSRDLATLTVLAYMGAGITTRGLQAAAKKRREEVLEMRKRGYDVLDALHRRTVGKLDEALRAAGVVGGDE